MLSPPVTDHYEELGVPRGATPAELRRAYRARARLLHPDAEGDAAAMRRLNEAWRVLRDPDSRLRYDQGLGLAGYAGDAQHEEPALRRHGSTPFARPGLWFLMVAVLLVIFVFTAYAGGGSGGAGGGP